MERALSSHREALLVFLFRYSVVWLFLAAACPVRGRNCSHNSYHICGIPRRRWRANCWSRRQGDVDDLMGEEDWVLKDDVGPGSLFLITERIAYDRGAGNGVVEARTPVAGVEFSISGPNSKANAGVSWVVAYPSATDVMCNGGYVGTTGGLSKSSERASRNRHRLSALIDLLCLGVERRNRRSLQAGRRRHPRRGEFNVIWVVELVRKHAVIWQIQLREDGCSQGCHVTIPVGR